ncbi:prion-inhibition and propagation-domain-containing protein [Aspergillus granulosus]|uniref:Prion-inhibition and propagation-domain-containing protein n=1 Tax=Aspergillus granulosus TaxID=176169 RepID=A0ABR4H0X0_9EURO
MTEPVSVVLATAGITGILTSCIECFEYIQLGRSFGKDYERCLLRLDLVRLRLSRWWESLHLPMSSAIPLSLRTPEDLQILRSTLEDILDQFDEAKNLSLKYHKPASIGPSTDLAVYDPDRDLAPNPRRLHGKLRDMALRRQKELGLSRRVTWALYDQKSYNQLIENVTDLVNSLVTLFPSEEFHLAQQKLCREEVEELELEYRPDLHILQETSCEVDNLLGETLRRAISTRGGNRYEGMTVTGHAIVENGDYVAQGSVVTGPGNLYSQIHISGATRVRNGTNYGGRGVFD